MNNTTGFSLIQLLIALAISSMLISGLFVTFFQMQTLQYALTSTVQIDRTMALIKSTIEKDIIAACIPERYIPLYAQEDATKEQLKDIDPHTAFVCSTKDGSIKTLSCISTRNIHITVPPTPAEQQFVYVTYTLVKDANSPFYTLTRSQIMELPSPSKKLSKAHEIVVAQHIQSLSATFWYYPATNQAKQQEEKPSLISTSDWRSGVTKKALPLWVDFACVVQDQNGREHSLKFSCELLNAPSYEKTPKAKEEQKPKEKAPEKKEEQKKASPTPATENKAAAKNTPLAQAMNITKANALGTEESKKTALLEAMKKILQQKTV